MTNLSISKPLVSWKRIYNLGVVLGVAGILVQAIFNNRWLGEVLILSGAAFFGLGFCSWMFAFLRERWSSVFGKIYLSAIHAAIFFVALIPARSLVSKVMELPAQDFDGTVGLVGVFIYPGLWLSITSLLILVCAAVMLVAGVLCQITCMPVVDDFIKFLAEFFPEGKVKVFAMKGRRDFAMRMFIHWTGAAVVSLGISSAGALPGKLLEEHGQIVKWLAYTADYQTADRYPGIEAGARYRLHENGVVSYASVSGGEVNIRVQVLNPGKCE